jgi:hypothetical protein
LLAAVVAFPLAACSTISGGSGSNTDPSGVGPHNSHGGGLGLTGSGPRLHQGQTDKKYGIETKGLPKFRAPEYRIPTVKIPQAPKQPKRRSFVNP